MKEYGKGGYIKWVVVRREDSNLSTLTRRNIQRSVRLSRWTVEKITVCNVTSDLIGCFRRCALGRGVYIKESQSRLCCVACSWFIFSPSGAKHEMFCNYRF